jgi:hypothetical protein
MDSYTTLKIGPKFAEALDGKTIYKPEDGRLMKVKPPKQNKGMDASQDLLRSFHDFQSEAVRGGKKNISDICGFEVWYDHEELEFCYFTPSQKREIHYRQQIDGHFRGCQIETREDWFISVEDGDYVTGGEVWLNKHYFEPIRSIESDDWDDPYLMLFSELHTRDDTRTLFQMMFQPAEPNWAKTKYENVEAYGESMQATKTKKAFYGFGPEVEIEPSKPEKDYAGRVLNQAGRPAFYLNIRYLVVSPDEEKARRHAKNVATRLEVGYQSVNGQTLITHPVQTPEECGELVRKIASRDADNMNRVRGYLPDMKNHRSVDKRKQMIMTIPEISGLMHMPTQKDVNLPAISWTDIPVEGTLPHNAKRFMRLTHEERVRQLVGHERAQQQMLEEFGLDERVRDLHDEHPKDSRYDQRAVFEAGIQTLDTTTNGDSQ